MNSDQIRDAIIADQQNADYTERGILPLYSVNRDARILLVGQAPGQKAQDKRQYWDDASGDRLREWMGISREMFYDPRQIAILPLDFYFPGKGKSGDLPPRKGFADKWHTPLLELMPNIELTVLIGSYAQKHYLGASAERTLTETVQNYANYLPQYWPLVHPSPRNRLWQRKNPWFDADVLPRFTARVQELLK